MKILVTGSDGFVGKELTNELKNKKHKIIEYNLSKGKNILNKKQLKKELKGVEVVIHLAGIIENSNINLWKVNVEGTKNVIEESVNAKVKKFIFLSSTGVYGSNTNLVNENSETKPENIYEKSKSGAEQIILNHQEEIHVNIIRSAMILGANDYWKKMFKVLKKGFPLPCSGKNIFQIIYVKELIQAMHIVIEKGEPGEIYLVSGKEKWTLKEFCQKSKKLMNLNEKVSTIPSWFAVLVGKIVKNDLMTFENIRHLKKSRNYDLKKIYSIGYKQKIPLEEAISKTIKELNN